LGPKAAEIAGAAELAVAASDENCVYKTERNNLRSKARKRPQEKMAQGRYDRRRYCVCRPVVCGVYFYLFRHVVHHISFIFV